jgi:transcriptional regulator with XRE-family HTH domain
MSPVTHTTEILMKALERAKKLGLDQRQLAARAGLSPETLSRAKKRGTMDSSSLERILGCVGFELALTPSGHPHEAQGAKDAGADHTGLISGIPTALRDPAWGLAWSNPDVQDEVLVRKALLTGGFTVILQSTLDFGLPNVMAQWEILRNSAEAPGPKTQELVCEILGNIEQGFSHAAA